MHEMHDGNIGHNTANAVIEIEVRLFNSVANFANGGSGGRQRLTLRPGDTVAEVLATLGIPPGEVFLVMVNGRDITPGRVGSDVRTAHELEHGDVLALSGPVPFSWGYGAPVV